MENKDKKPTALNYTDVKDKNNITVDKSGIKLVVHNVMEYVNNFSDLEVQRNKAKTQEQKDAYDSALNDLAKVGRTLNISWYDLYQVLTMQSIGFIDLIKKEKIASDSIAMTTIRTLRNNNLLSKNAYESLMDQIKAINSDTKKEDKEK